MTTGNKLAQLRKQNNYTQEQFADLMGVSRQAVSKWENDLAYPETEKLIQIGKLYGCSMDYLLNDDAEEKPAEEEKSTETQTAAMPNVHMIGFVGLNIRERKSEKTMWGLPLWHIGKNAHGIIAIGMTARGVVSIGLLSAGVVSLGLWSLGLLSIGLVAVGLFAAGTIAAGIIAAGAIAFGVVSFGALAIGKFAFGAAAFGKYFAKGDEARAMVALGKTTAEGSTFARQGEVTAADKSAAVDALRTVVPGSLNWAKRIVEKILL